MSAQVITALRRRAAALETEAAAEGIHATGRDPGTLRILAAEFRALADAAEGDVPPHAPGRLTRLVSVTTEALRARAVVMEAGAATGKVPDNRGARYSAEVIRFVAAQFRALADQADAGASQP